LDLDPGQFDNETTFFLEGYTMSQNLAFSLHDLSDEAFRIVSFVSDHADQASAVLAAVTAVGADMAAGNVAAALVDVGPLVAILQSDLATVAAPVTDSHRHALKAKLQSANLGANGAIIAQLIAALQKAGGISAVITKLLPIIQQIITMFPTPVVKPAA
jgi:hypothetical protein